ncbi:SURF1-like protein [Arenicella chitinivorans]|uniref:SURF1-like protein n=2 Tax=Arenicella chitinivorans TaxID=1329800 RepID=A0A918RN01_9GAMM|nr:SURF1-like protein [Arenicella chitinivorans]
MDRAEQKKQILIELQTRSKADELDAKSLRAAIQSSGFKSDYRYRKVRIDGRFLPEHTLFVDRQVMQTKVGYLVVTPFRPTGTDDVMLVARGWVPAGDDRQALPDIRTPVESVELSGRLNVLTPPPPLWDERYSVMLDEVWQFLPEAELEARLGFAVLPLMLELAPSTPAPVGFKIQWPAIDDQWVAKHSAYAFQWFAMAAAFVVACLVLVFRRQHRKTANEDA